MRTCGVILCTLLGLAPALALAGPSSSDTLAPPEDLLSGVDVVRDPKAGATYYFPQFDQWPRPDVTIYPIVAASDSGSRTAILKVVIRGTPRHLDRSFRLFIDGVPTALSLDQKGAIFEDDTGCQPATRITVGGQDEMLRKIVAASHVEIRFEERGSGRYEMTREDVDRVRKALALYEAAVLPPAPVETTNPPTGDTLPELIRASKVTPKFPPGVYRPDRDLKAKVILDATIRVDGSVGDLRVSQAAGGDCGFEEAALEAVKQWKYKPATRGGQPIETKFKVSIEFFTQNSTSPPLPGPPVTHPSRPH